MWFPKCLYTSERHVYMQFLQYMHVICKKAMLLVSHTCMYEHICSQYHLYIMAFQVGCQTFRSCFLYIVRTKQSFEKNSSHDFCNKQESVNCMQFTTPTCMLSTCMVNNVDSSKHYRHSSVYAISSLPYIGVGAGPAGLVLAIPLFQRLMKFIIDICPRAVTDSMP